MNIISIKKRGIGFWGVVLLFSLIPGGAFGGQGPKAGSDLPELAMDAPASA
ncbi:MAG: hypothetical protein GY859_17335, partial [Desulfobacterales bacterium]|nr:hypothetical protein [Desulfobacterales bacterium]